jgi:peptide/nickel transport system permease protein
MATLAVNEVVPEASSSSARAVFSSPSWRLVGRRVLAAIPVTWGVTFLSYLVMNMLPGDAASALLGLGATPAEVHALTLKLHLNEPLLTRYWHWLTQVVQGNLGHSLTNGLPVASIIGQRIWVTFALLGYAFVISVVFSVPLALVSARKPGGLIDRATMALSMGGLSIAPYVLPLILILIFSIRFQLFPAVYPNPHGFLSTVRALTLPAFSFGFPLTCFYTRLLRADLVKQMQSEEYVVTAHAKGLSSWRVLTRHTLRNSLFSFITVLGLNVGTLLAGTVIVESIFAIPGIGQLLLQSIQNRDVPIVEALVLIFAAFAVLANLLADLAYAVLDPRIRHGRAAA